MNTNLVISRDSHVPALFHALAALPPGASAPGAAAATTGSSFLGAMSPISALASSERSLLKYVVILPSAVFLYPFIPGPVSPPPPPLPLLAVAVAGAFFAVVEEGLSETFFVVAVVAVAGGELALLLLLLVVLTPLVGAAGASDAAFTAFSTSGVHSLLFGSRTAPARNASAASPGRVSAISACRIRCWGLWVWSSAGRSFVRNGVGIVWSMF